MTTDSVALVAAVAAPAAASSATATPAVPADGAPAGTSTTVPPTTAQQPDAPASTAPVSSDPLSLDEVPPSKVPDLSASATGKTVTYESTNNPGLDLALSFIGKLGIGPDHPSMKAAEAGNFDMLRATLATMGAKAQGWEANVALGEKAFNEANALVKAKQAEDRKAILEVVGGEANWTAVRDFAKAATADSPTEKAAINKALSEGGVTAKAMAVYLHTLHQQKLAGAPIQEPAAVVAQSGGSAASSSQAPGQPSATGGPLSPREYTAAVAALNSTMRGRMDGSPEYKALQARRSMWRGDRG